MTLDRTVGQIPSVSVNELLGVIKCCGYSRLQNNSLIGDILRANVTNKKKIGMLGLSIFCTDHVRGSDGASPVLVGLIRTLDLYSILGARLRFFHNQEGDGMLYHACLISFTCTNTSSTNIMLG